MPQFRVFGVSSSGARFTLTEALGIYHVAVARTGLATRNTFVDSERAAIGPGTLRNRISGQPIDVIFEAVSCNLGEALRLLQA
jgi:hypothetical protein